MSKFKQFLERKDIEISAKRYLLDGLTTMTTGLFASLLTGVILKTLGEQLAKLIGDCAFTQLLITLGGTAQGLMGATVGCAVACGLKAPPLVIFTSAVTGMIGASNGGGPAGALIAGIIGAELGKAVSKETKLDILVTPATTMIAGGTVGILIAPLVGALMTGLGQVIMTATEMQPFIMGIIISVIVGFVLVAPLSSAALCIMLDLTGIAAGAATVGCSVQMVGFAIASFKENGSAGIFAQGLGTAKLQMANSIKNPWILLPTILTSAILGPVATCIFHMENIAVGAGMGTSGLVGQICTFTTMGFSGDVLVKVLILHFLLPGLMAFAIDKILRKTGKIKFGDYKLDL